MKRRPLEIKIEITDEALPKKAGVLKSIREKKGIHGLTKAQLSALGREKLKNKRGIFGRSKEQHAADSQKAGRGNVELKRGIFSEEFLEGNPLSEQRSTEERREAGRELKRKGRGFNASELYGYGSHIRHHVKKLVFNPKCHFCVNPVPLSQTKAARKSRQYRETGSTLEN